MLFLIKTYLFDGPEVSFHNSEENAIDALKSFAKEMDANHFEDNKFQKLSAEIEVEGIVYNSSYYFGDTLIHFQQPNDNDKKQIFAAKKNFCSCCGEYLSPDTEAYTDFHTKETLCEAHADFNYLLDSYEKKQDNTYEIKRKYTVRIICDDESDNWQTEINGTPNSIADYFRIGSQWNVGHGESDHMATVKKLVFLS